MSPNQGTETSLEITKNTDDDITRDIQNAEVKNNESTKTEAKFEFVPKIIWLNAIAISLFLIISVVTFPFIFVFKMKFLTYLNSKYEGRE